jgi:hypothetical protein
VHHGQLGEGRKKSLIFKAVASCGWVATELRVKGQGNWNGCRRPKWVVGTGTVRLQLKQRRLHNTQTAGFLHKETTVE